MSLVRLAAAIVGLGVAMASGAATDPGLAGPFDPAPWSAAIPATRGATLQADVHYPGDGAGGVALAAGRCPAVVFGHGFASSRDRHVEFGRHLASRGYIVVIPNFVGFSDHSRNADDLVACVDWLVAQDADPSSRLHGRVDTTALGASGYSAGGLSSLVAFARDSRLRAAAPLDPVDNAELGVTELAAATGPVAITHSEDSACNANGSARALYAAARPPKRRVRIVGGNHCDPQMPSDFACGLVCGNAVAARQALYRRVVTGWLEMYLRCDPDYEPWVSGTEMQADVAAGRVEYAADPDPPPAPCTGTPPPEVTGLRISKAGGDARLAWDPVAALPEVTEYLVLREPEPAFPAGLPARSTPAPAFDDPGVLTDGTPLWCYLVRAVNAAGVGP